MNGLKQIIDNMNHTVKKNDIIEQYNKTTTSLNNELLPMLVEVNKLIKDNNLELKDLPELNTLNRVSEFKSKDLRDLFGEITKIIKNIDKKSNNISSIIDDELPDLISKDVITIKQATVLNILAKINNLVLYTPDLILYVIDLIDYKITESKLSMIKTKVSEIRQDMSTYGTILKFFKEYNNIDDKFIKKLSNDKVLTGGKDKNAINMLNGIGSRIPLTGFIGNPIYHIKIWWMDKKLEQYEVLKEKKKLTELKILELQTRKNGENNPKLEKAIEYHTDKLESLEYKIREIEE